MGCSRGVPGVFRGCSGLFRAVPGGVPGMFRGVPGVFQGVPGVLRVLQTPKYCHILEELLFKMKPMEHYILYVCSTEL